MFEFLLIALVVIAVVVFVEIAYNSLIFRQKPKPSAKQWVGFLAISAFGALLIVSTMIFADDIKNLPYIGWLVKLVDAPAKLFVKSTPIMLIAIVVGIALLVVFGYFIIRGLVVYKRKKKNFDLAEEKKVSEQESTKKVEETPSEVVETVEEVEEDEKPKEEIPEVSEDPIHFIKNVSLSGFNYKDANSLREAYLAAKGQLQLAETKSGYIAIYRDLEGLGSLKKLLSQNSIDISQLENKPMIVMFNQDKIKALNFKNWYQKVKGAK